MFVRQIKTRGVMQGFLAAILALTTLALVLLVLVQARRGTADLLSVRNFFLLGVIVFQLLSGVLTLWTDRYGDVPAVEQPRVGAIYTGMVLAFLLFLFLFYRMPQPAGVIARWFGADLAPPPPASLVVLGMGFLVIGVLMRFVLQYVPYIGLVFNAMGTGVILVSVAMAAWAWASRLWNPAIAVGAVAIFGVALFCVLAGAYGRRDLIGFIGACVWGAYHGHWKHLGFRAVAMRLGVLGAGGVLLFGAMTATRQSERLVHSPLEVAERLVSRNPLEGLFDLMHGQWAAANSMYLIGSRPQSEPYDTLHTARYALTHPVPRALWADKPGGLGMRMPDELNITNVGEELNFGPGLIGHIWNDNPWLAFLPYTLVLAVTLRVFDQLITRSPTNPFVILPIVVGIGELIGLARGEAGLFYVRAVAYTAGAWIGMWLVARVFRALGWIAPPEYYVPEDEEAFDAYGEEPAPAAPLDTAS